MRVVIIAEQRHIRAIRYLIGGSFTKPAFDQAHCFVVLYRGFFDFQFRVHFSGVLDFYQYIFRNCFQLESGYRSEFTVRSNFPIEIIITFANRKTELSGMLFTFGGFVFVGPGKSCSAPGFCIKFAVLYDPLVGGEVYSDAAAAEAFNADTPMAWSVSELPVTDDRTVGVTYYNGRLIGYLSLIMLVPEEDGVIVILNNNTVGYENMIGLAATLVAQHPGARELCPGVYAVPPEERTDDRWFCALPNDIICTPYDPLLVLCALRPELFEPVVRAGAGGKIAHTLIGNTAESHGVPDPAATHAALCELARRAFG